MKTTQYLFVTLYVAMASYYGVIKDKISFHNLTYKNQILNAT